nr:transcription factor MYB1 [Arachis hypogaea]
MTSKKRKIAWSEKEDNLLRDAVQRFGEGHWATIAKRGNFSVKRTAKQINQLPPEWTDQFDFGIQTIDVIQARHGLINYRNR